MIAKHKPPPPTRADELEVRLIGVSSIQPVLTDKFLVKDWLTQQGLSMLYGASNTGKTFVALDIAVHVAMGKAWFGHKVAQGSVLYIAAEGGSGVLNRLAALKQRHPELNDAPFYLLQSGLNLHGADDVLALREIMLYPEPALIVVDTLARSMGAGDENTAKDAAMFIGNCDLIREVTGAHVLIVHHTGKETARGARGSSALRAAVDTEIQVTDKGEIISRKQRDMEGAETLGFELCPVWLGKDEDGDSVMSAVIQAGVPKKRPTKPINDKSELALSALDLAADTHGVFATEPPYPLDAKIVLLRQWREACDAKGLSSGGSESAPRQAFNRAKTDLTELGKIEMAGDYVWRVQSDDESQS